MHHLVHGVLIPLSMVPLVLFLLSVFGSYDERDDSWAPRVVLGQQVQPVEPQAGAAGAAPVAGPLSVDEPPVGPGELN